MKQTGGSVASDAVTSLVTPDTYSMMNSSFTNTHGGKQCGGGFKCPTCGGSKKKNPPSKHQKGGSANASASLGEFMSSLAKNTSAALGVKAPFVNSGSIFRSQPALALNSVLPRNVGLQANAKAHFTNASSKPTTMNVAKPAFVHPVMKNPFTNQENNLHYGGKKPSKSKVPLPKKKLPLPKKKLPLPKKKLPLPKKKIPPPKKKV